MKQTKQPQSRRHRSRRGAFSAGITALAIALVVIFNLLIGQIPAVKLQKDMTDNKIYEISDVSRDYLANLDHDITMHVMANQSTLDSRIVRFIDNYVSLSDRVTVDYTDPTVYPSVLSTYDTEPDTIVVRCDDTDRQEIVRFSSLIGIDEMAYYTQRTYREVNFDCEGQLTSAIDGVLTDVAYQVYETTGHNENMMPISIEGLFRKQHMSVTIVDLLKDGGMPDDCSLLVINGPTEDLADTEKEMISAYLAEGGQVVYQMSSQNKPLPNFDSLCAEFGMTVEDGLIADPSLSINNNPYLFFPTVSTTVDAAGTLPSDASVLLYATRGMTLKEPARTTIEVNPILTSTENSTAYVDEENQTTGSYVIGAVATETVDDNTFARFTVYGSESLLSPDILNSFPSIDNATLFMTSSTVGFPALSQLNIQPVSLLAVNNTITTGGVWAILFIFIIPITLLVFGFVRWMRRRKL